MAKLRLTKRGRRLLRLAASRIERMPRTLNMMTWVWHDHKPHRRKPGVPEHYCQTQACVAGHVVLAAGGPAADYITVEFARSIGVRGLDADRLRSGVMVSVREAARGILFYKADRERGEDALFYTRGWPVQFRMREARAQRPSTHARVAAARIRHLLATGE